MGLAFIIYQQPLFLNNNYKTSILKKNNGKEATNRLVVEKKMIKNKTNLLKLLILILVMVVMTTTLTGCISLALGGGTGLMVSNDQLVDVTTQEPQDGVIVLHGVNQVVADIKNPDSIYGAIVITRKLPLFLFQSVLSGDGSDNLASVEPSNTLEPETVLTSTVNAFDTLIGAGQGIAEKFQDFALIL